MNTTATRVILALAPVEEDAIADSLYAADTATVVGSAADAGELTRLTVQVEAELVLLSAQLPGLDGGLIARLHANGLRVAALVADTDAAEQLSDLDLDATITPDRIEHAIADLRTLDRQEHDGRTATTTTVRTAREREGSVLAVVGSKGAPGASELAASFAATVAEQWPVLLVECDGDGGQLALRLGADPRNGSLLGPVRALKANQSDIGQLLPRWLSGDAHGWPQVLLGLPDPSNDLAELNSPGLLEQLLAVLAASFPLVVCDVGQRLRRGVELDHAVRLHRELLVAADAVLLVLGSRQEQLQTGLAQLELLHDELGITPDRLRVIVNGQGAAGAVTASEATTSIGDELAERGLAVDAWVPWDNKALQASVRLGRPLALARPRGSYGQAVRRLTEAVLLPSSPQPAARKRRLQKPLAAVAAAGQEVTLPWRR